MYTPRIAVTFGSTGPGRSGSNYLDCLTRAGAEAVPLTPGQELEPLYRDLDGVLLTGGPDVDPALYGEPPDPELGTVDRLRDEMEIELLRVALRLDFPVLAICRGHQLLNVALGGRLQQHIPSDSHRALEGGRGASQFHKVLIEEGSALAELLGPAPRTVNSRHHQAVRPGMIADGLLPSAISLDGIVEGLESPTHRFVLSVQWHPERPEVAEAEAPLFQALVSACREARAAIPG
jgi:putative glutamine amidotransferase